jgi:hypothetical protein
MGCATFWAIVSQTYLVTLIRARIGFAKNNLLQAFI